MPFDGAKLNCVAHVRVGLLSTKGDIRFLMVQKVLDQAGGAAAASPKPVWIKYIPFPRPKRDITPKRKSTYRPYSCPLAGIWIIDMPDIDFYESCPPNSSLLGCCLALCTRIGDFCELISAKIDKSLDMSQPKRLGLQSCSGALFFEP